MLYYTSVERMIGKLPMLNSITNITSADMLLFAEDAEAEVNGYLAKLYTVPVPGGAPLLTSISTDVALYKLLSQRVVVNEAANKSSLPDRYKEALELLKSLANGEVTLVNSAGSVIDISAESAAWSSTMGYVPTTNEGPVESLAVDPNKLADIAAGSAGRTWSVDAEGNTIWD